MEGQSEGIHGGRRMWRWQRLQRGGSPSAIATCCDLDVAVDYSLCLSIAPHHTQVTKGSHSRWTSNSSCPMASPHPNSSPPCLMYSFAIPFHHVLCFPWLLTPSTLLVQLLTYTTFFSLKLSICTMCPKQRNLYLSCHIQSDTKRSSNTVIWSSTLPSNSMCIPQKSHHHCPHSWRLSISQRSDLTPT